MEKKNERTRHRVFCELLTTDRDPSPPASMIKSVLNDSAIWRQSLMLLGLVGNTVKGEGLLFISGAKVRTNYCFLTNNLVGNDTSDVFIFLLFRLLAL